MTQALRNLFALLLFAQISFGAGPGQRWDNSAVAGAGMPSFAYGVVPVYPESSYPGAVHSQPYLYEMAMARLLVSTRNEMIEALGGQQLPKSWDLPVGSAVGLLGRPGARVVAPGDPANSELLDRMRRRGGGQMPLIGSHIVDERGVALIREWIGSLPVAGE